MSYSRQKIMDEERLNRGGITITGKVSETAKRVAEELKGVSRPLITVDGPCASGKTTLAEKLAGCLRASVVHTDDYVVPHGRKTEERLALPGGNCDWERLVREVAVPWKSGLPVLIRRYDCGADCLLQPEELPDCAVLILEGSYSNLPAIRRCADVCLFVDAPIELRERRLRERETPASLKRFHDLWIPLENAHFEAFGLPDERCIVIRGEPEEELRFPEYGH